jgi:hypothetical protein
MIAPWYVMAYAKLDRIAMRHGYALALHGSMSRDLDLIAIPWTDDAADPEKLLKAIDRFVMEKTTSVNRHGNKLGNFYATKKPHGRLAYAIHIGHDGHYLDLSIMPRQSRAQRQKGRK